PHGDLADLGGLAGAFAAFQDNEQAAGLVGGAFFFGCAAQQGFEFSPQRLVVAFVHLPVGHEGDEDEEDRSDQQHAGGAVELVAELPGFESGRPHGGGDQRGHRDRTHEYDAGHGV